MAQDVPLGGAMEKSSCLDPETVENYVRGHIQRDVAAAVEEHVLDCPVCAMAIDREVDFQLALLEVNGILESRGKISGWNGPDDDDTVLPRTGAHGWVSTC